MHAAACTLYMQYEYIHTCSVSIELHLQLYGSMRCNPPAQTCVLIGLPNIVEEIMLCGHYEHGVHVCSRFFLSIITG